MVTILCLQHMQYYPRWLPSSNLRTHNVFLCCNFRLSHLISTKSIPLIWISTNRTISSNWISPSNIMIKFILGVHLKKTENWICCSGGTYILLPKLTTLHQDHFCELKSRNKEIQLRMRMKAKNTEIQSGKLNWDIFTRLHKSKKRRFHNENVN